MTSLHAYFYNRDQAAFQRHLSTAHPTDVNARDWLGRTVLHLVCAASTRDATEYVRMLLVHPAIDVNLQDEESHWTALHRALYNGNIAAAILLLQRADIDTALKDPEGYRAFDLYNTTVNDTMPNKCRILNGLELYTWGANRNSSLGHGDNNDRSHPEQVILMQHNSNGNAGEDSTTHDNTSSKLQPVMVRDVQMSKLHTVVLTEESRANIRACGFASTGRLGPSGGQHTQLSLLPIVRPGSESVFTAIALGQDHTLALTSDGTIFSWGLGRFFQLGYDVPAPHVQASPRVIAGPLRRERVRGIATCKSASACWTDTLLYTWGKNNGQLGYDKNASPVQPIPRVVTKFSKPVISVALNDTAMACLLATRDVILLFNDTQSRIVFPSPTRLLPLEFLAYNPPQPEQDIIPPRIFCNENTFATVTSRGEIFTFNVPTPPPPGERPPPVQPQRVWTLRKPWSAVHDAALDGDGSLIICTQSGHVFVRSRSGFPKAPRFARVTGLQRVIAVRASDTGALAALREPYRPPDIAPVGNDLVQDLARLRPYLSFTRPEHVDMRIEPKLEISVNPVADILPGITMDADEEGDDEDGDSEPESLARDGQEVLRLWDILTQDRIARRRSDDLRQGLFAKGTPSHGADIMLRIQSLMELPVHRVILSARCTVLARVLGGMGSLHDRGSGISLKLLPAPAEQSGAGPPQVFTEMPRLAITGVHAFPVLVLLHYLYTDVLLVISDPRLVRLTGDAFAHGHLQPAQAVRELQTLSRVLHLGALDDALRGAVQRAPAPLLNVDFRAIFDAPMSVSSPDVVLHLADREVWSHSFVLRARSPFFEGLFVDKQWTRDRWESGGKLRVDLRHFEWRSMQYVLRFMCCGEGAEMFENLDFVDSADQLLSLLLDVMFAANELLLDRLILICSSILVKYVTINNISAIYMESASLHCPRLMDSLHQYMSVNMETLLEARLLDELSPQLIKQLASAVQCQQVAKSPIRFYMPTNLAAAVQRNREWLALQDIPCPIVRSQSKMRPKLSPRVSRKPSQPTFPESKLTLPRSPYLANTSEDLFCMDEALVPHLQLDAGASADKAGNTLKDPPWMGKSTPKVDMKAILAEAEMQASGRRQHAAASSLTSVHRQRSGDGMHVSFSLPRASDVPHSSSPGISRTASTPTRRGPSLSAEPSSSSPRRVANAQTLARTPPGARKVSENTSPAQSFSASTMQKSWRTQSAPGPGPSTSTRPGQPGLGPVINPPKAKAGLTVTRHAPGNAWVLPPAEPVFQVSPSGAPVSFAEIQQLQSQPNTVAKERRSLPEIQAEEAELQAEAEFMKWWTAEEERVRLENEAIAASLMQSQSQPQPQDRHHHHGHGKKNKKSAGAGEGEAAAPSPKASSSSGERKRRVARGVPSSDRQKGQPS